MEKRYPAMPDTWNAIDSLGRALPAEDNVGGPRERFVGLFYWTWHNSPGGRAVNVTKTIRENPDAVHDYGHPIWRDIRGGHWDEPIYGFYKSYNKWVLRKHAELLADAGVDVVIFDNTNGTAVWEESYMALAETFSKAREDGVNAPKMTFLLPLHMGDAKNNNENCRVQLRSIYQRFFKPGLYRDMWFYWKGKPLILAYPDGLDPKDPLEKEILNFFTFRPVQPSYVRGQQRYDHWGWLSLYPQKIYANPDGTPEQITVGVAQNHNEKIGLTAMNAPNAFGRSYTSKGFDTRPDAKLWGANFQEQWDYALKVDPEFVFVTGWNEWTAGRYDVWQKIPNAFPDEYNDANSRDCEPTKGDLKDNYYYQLCANIRRFKGARPQMKAAAPTPLTLYSAREAWDEGGAAYGSYSGNTAPRDEYGYENIHYVNHTGRNDMIYSKVSHDRDYVYFLAACREPITAPDAAAWMRLFIRTRELRPTWEGFHFAVNRICPDEHAYLEENLGGWKWRLAEKLDYTLDGTRLIVRVPRKALGLDTPEFKLWFKWMDHTCQDGDIMDVYNDGDCAPGGRFMYYYCGKDE